MNLHLGVTITSDVSSLILLCVGTTYHFDDIGGVGSDGPCRVFTGWKKMRSSQLESCLASKVFTIAFRKV